MRVCSYCKKNKKLTREHIIPNWFLNINPSPDDIQFSEIVPRKFLSTDSVIKDVCAECNNIKLSALDAYGKSLYNDFFIEHVFKDETIDLRYNYDLLCKWLIKLSYNSARVNKADLEVLNDYGKYLIEDRELPENIIVYCGLISPSNINDYENITLASRHENCELYAPDWFRIGVFRVPEFDSQNWVYRHVTINSYSFFMFIPKLKHEDSYEESKLIEAIKKANTYGVKLENSGRVIFPAPVLDAYSSFAVHMYNNPITYDIPFDNISSAIVNKEFGLVLYSIPREDIESGNTSEILQFLNNIISCREVTLGYMQKIEFMVDGYDDDPRELYEISEVISYFNNLNKLFPYWMFLQSEGGQWLKVLVAILCEGKTIEHKKVAMNGELMKDLLDTWFVSLNKLSHQCAISERLNRKISEDAMKVICEGRISS